MSDVVVTVPKGLWEEWCDEGDLPGDPWSGDFEYGFNLYGEPPDMAKGGRVYIVAHGKLRGYAPLSYIDYHSTRFGGNGRGYALVRHGEAVAVTIDEPIRGFRGWRYRWWDESAEKPFPRWRKP